MYSSSIKQFGGGSSSPDYLYYNADIVNNTTGDVDENGKAVVEPQIRFNETRDTALIKNVSDYYFSIIRFQMNGSSKDLPLFIPNIREGTGQTNPNLTEYAVGCGWTQSFATNATPATNPITLSALPAMRRMIFRTDTQNETLAPVPRGLQSINFQNFYSGSIAYSAGQIVEYTPSGVYSAATDPLFIYNSYSGPFWTATIPPPQTDSARWKSVVASSSYQPWNPNNSYLTSDFVSVGGSAYQALTPITGGKIPSGQTPTSTSIYWTATDDNQGQSQDLSSRYYWLYTYNAFVQQWNNTMFDVANPNRSAVPGAVSTSAWQDTYNAISTAITAYNTANGTSYTTPWTTFGAFCDQYVPPQLIYDVETGKFRILASNMCFGTLVQTFTPSGASGTTLGQAASPQSRLFFNTNLAGLLSNFQNRTWNTPGSSSSSFSAYPITTTQPSLSVPNGYAVEILFPNRFWSNVVDYRNAPTSAGSNPAPAGYVPTNYAWVYWVAEQDYTSTDSLWSPISSLVFTTSLIPVKTEATAQPVNLGSGNTGVSAATSQSAFQPIITDIAIDTSQGTIGVAAYRQSVYYAPVAEYRLADFAASNQELRNIDIQVFWKGRLDNVLYPIRMYNMSSVNIKILFKKKGVEGKIPDY